MYLHADRSLARISGALTGEDPGDLPRVQDRRMQRIRCYLTLALADFAALVVSFVAANTIYLQQPAADHGFTVLLVMVPIYFCFAAINASYGGEALLRQEKSFTRSAQAVLFAGTAVALIVFLLKAGNEVSRAVFVIGWVLALVGVPMLRLAISRPLLNRMGGTPYSRVVIVDGADYEPAHDDIVMPLDRIGFDPSSTDPHGFHALAGAVTNADRIVIVTRPERYAAWSTALKGIAVKGELLSPGDDKLGIVGVGRHQNRPTMVISHGPLTLRDRMTKRLFDLVIASIGLIATSPVLLATAIAIKLEFQGTDPVHAEADRSGQQDLRMLQVPQHVYRSLRCRCRAIDHQERSPRDQGG